MSDTKQKWTLTTVPTSVGICHKIGPLGSTTKIKDACLYDDCYTPAAYDHTLLAQARLMCAAPQMLESLKAVLARHEEDYGRCLKHEPQQCPYCRAKDVIKSAEGE